MELPTITIRELTADEAEERGLDPSLREYSGPLVQVRTSRGDSFVAVAEVVRVSPEYLTEV